MIFQKVEMVRFISLF